MNGTRILGAVCASILATSLGTLVACGGSSDDKSSSTVDPAVTAKTVQAASVMVEIADANGLKVGQATATVIAPRLVLTAGHMIAGQSKWVITTADGKKVTGSKGLTYDWHKYDSDKAHPRKHDVGVIYLDSPIKLDAYPSVVAQTSTIAATRISGQSGAFIPVGASLSWLAAAPNNYVTSMSANEVLDTGGAVFDAHGIVGVVEGKGLSTGQLYIARADGVQKWLLKKASCAGASTTTTFAVGKAKQQICDDAGNAIGANPGDSNNPSGSSPSGSNPSGSSPNSSNEGPNQCQDDDHDGIDSKTDTGESTTGLNDSTGPGGADRNSSGGAGSNGNNSGSNGPNGSSSTTGSDNSQNGSTGNNGNNTGGAGSNDNTGNNNNTGSNNNSTGNDSNTGSGSNNVPSGGAGSSSNSSNNGGSNVACPVPQTEPCQGPSDNSETCPPEPADCKGAECGGSNVEPAGIDRGFCQCLSAARNNYWLK